MTQDRADRKAVLKWLSETSQAAMPFECRWTMAALRRVDADLCRRFEEQRALFDKACITGAVEDVERHGAALCRGYTFCVRALEGAQEPDSAYFLGECHRTGYRVAIGPCKVSGDRVSEIHGRKVIHITPDEVAAILVGLEGFKMIAAVKSQWPGAEVIDIYPDEPAKEESGVLEVSV